MKPIRRDAFRLSPEPDSMVAESPSVGLYGETGLHDTLKRLYAGPGARLEVRIGSSVADVVRADGEIVEIQTANLRALKDKVAFFRAAPRSAIPRFRIVHPIVIERMLLRLDPLDGTLQSTRKSPKRENLWTVFDELVKAPWILSTPHLVLDLVFVRVQESRKRDGSGSWRRRGDRTIDRVLVELVETRTFASRRDWKALIPRALQQPFSSKSLGEALKTGADQARKMLYAFCKAGLIQEAGSSGRHKLYIRKPA